MPQQLPPNLPAYNLRVVSAVGARPDTSHRADSDVYLAATGRPDLQM